MAIALALILVVVGSVLFHVWSPWWWTPIASNWRYIDDTILITFWITGIVFIAVVLFTAYCLFRFRYRPGQTAVYEPENKRLEWGLTIATALGVAAMLAPGLFVWNHFITVPKDATEVEALGQQWQWSYRLPGKDGQLGLSGTHNVSSDNPLGLSSHDPNAKDDLVIEGADLHLQVDKPVKVLMRSVDVIHDFYVPEFRAKMDIVPGGHLRLVHAHEDRNIRSLLRRILWHRTLRHARKGRRRQRGRLPEVARRAEDVRKPYSASGAHEDRGLRSRAWG
jgi:cytochrome c oxidase subunit 2